MYQQEADVGVPIAIVMCAWCAIKEVQVGAIQEETAEPLIIDGTLDGLE